MSDPRRSPGAAEPSSLQSGEIIVYTCVTGGYDELPDVTADSERIRFVCFLEGTKRGGASGWEIRPSAAPPRLTSGHDVNRYHKLFAHRVLPEARYSIYLDGNIRYLGEYGELVRRIRDEEAAFGAFRHPDRRSLAEEVMACERLGKLDAFDLGRVDEQLALYAAEGLDPSLPITANYLIVRDHAHPALPTMSALWWSQLFEFAKRDQLSSSYALWKTDLPWVFLDDDPSIRAEDLERTRHYRSLLRRGVHRIRRWTSR